MAITQFRQFLAAVALMLAVLPCAPSARVAANSAATFHPPNLYSRDFYKTDMVTARGRTLLDQWPTPRCTAYSLVSALMNGPGLVSYINPDWVFMEGVKIDGVSGNEDGLSGGSHMWAMLTIAQQAGMVEGWDAAFTTERAEGWLRKGYPLIVSSAWIMQMSNSEDDYYGTIAMPTYLPDKPLSWHAWFVYRTDGEYWYAQNTYGLDINQGGFFRVKIADIDRLQSEFPGGSYHTFYTALYVCNALCGNAILPRELF